jgi:hypothetical protein
VNAGSVNHDAPNDVISLADAVKIAQFLVGNLNGFYLEPAAPLTRPFALPAGQTVATDATAPSTSTSQAPEANVNHWNRTNVSVTLTATDPSGPAQPGQTTVVSGVKEIRHRVNGGSVVVTAGASTQIVLGAEGVHTITYFAVDNAGNQEGAKNLTVRIDKTPPNTECNVDPNKLRPANHKLVSVTATVTVTDPLSGPAGFLLSAVTSSERDDGLGDGDTPNDIQGWAIGTTDTTGQLRAERFETRLGRVYTITYTARDMAGNSATCAATVTVPHDQSK